MVTAIKQLGFHSVVEAALGADMVAYKESKELAEKGFSSKLVLSRIRNVHREGIPDYDRQDFAQPVTYG